MPNVTVVTPMRDAERHLDRYFRQLALLDWPVDWLRVVIVEGDHTDNTAALVADWQRAAGRQATMIRFDTGSPKYGSVVNPDRFRTLAKVFNAGLDAVDLAWSDYVLFLPVDIEYVPDLLRRLEAWRVDVVAPLTFMNSAFYDFWALSRDGHFYPPFREEDAEGIFGGRLTEMTTVGGTLLIDARVLRAGVRYGEAEVDRDFSRAAREAGFVLWLDPTMHVYHQQ